MQVVEAPSPEATARASAPLRIVIGLEGLALGGCPINALDLARTLRQNGHHVTVFAINETVRVSVLPYAESSGFQVELLDGRGGIASLVRQMRRLAKRESADIIHVFAPWLGP